MEQKIPAAKKCMPRFSQQTCIWIITLQWDKCNSCLHKVCPNYLGNGNSAIFPPTFLIASQKIAFVRSQSAVELMSWAKWYSGKLKSIIVYRERIRQHCTRV